MGEDDKHVYLISDAERQRRSERMAETNRKRAADRKAGILPVKAVPSFDAEGEWRKSLKQARPGSQAHAKAIERLEEFEADRAREQAAASVDLDALAADIAALLRDHALVVILERDWNLAILDTTPEPVRPEPDPGDFTPEPPEPVEPEPVVPEPPITAEERLAAGQFVVPSTAIVLKLGEEQPPAEHRVADERYWREAEADFERRAPRADDGPANLGPPPWR